MKKYFIEALLIFLSILGSFFIESYRIKQNSIENKNNLLSELIEVINEDLKQIENIISLQKESIDACNRIIKNNTGGKTMSEETIAENHLKAQKAIISFYCQKGIYSQLLLSGSLELISFRSLRLKLIYVYDHLNERKLGIDRATDDYASRSSEMLNNNIILLTERDQLNKNYIYSDSKLSSVIISDSYYNSPEVLGYYNSLLNTSTNYIDLLKLFKIEFEEIIDLIDQEINL